MDYLARFERIEKAFFQGELAAQDLVLSLEPLLLQISKDQLDEREVRGIVNNLELILYTLPADQQGESIAQLLRRARSYAVSRLPCSP